MTQPQQLAAELRVPVHSRAAVPGYGTWAAGPGYKVSFHDGFVFYPLLGRQAPRSLPLRWQTKRVTVAGRPLWRESAEAVHQSSSWRYEYRWPGVTEAYDVRKDGVEQTFTIHEPPAERGDLVVEGRFVTPLAVRAPERSSAAVEFVDRQGNARIRYGAAIAFDQRGDRVPVERVVRGRDVQLRVPAAWLQHAAFPVVVDPLTSPVTLSQSLNSSLVGATAAAVLPQAGVIDRLVHAVTRYASASDQDLYVFTANTDFSGAALMHYDLTASWSSEQPAVEAWSSHWHVATRRASGSTSTIRLYSHIWSNTTPNGGSAMTAPVGRGSTAQSPALRPAGSTGLYVVWQESFASAPGQGVIRASRFEVATSAFGAVFSVSDSNEDARSPCVVKGLASAAFCAWESRSLVQPGPRQIRGRQVDASGPVTQIEQISPADQRAYTKPMMGRVSTISSHNQRAIAYEITDNGIKSIGVTRFRLGIQNGGSISVTHHRTPVVGQSYLVPELLGMARTMLTDSHWSLLYRMSGYGSSLRVLRLGYTCGTVESAMVHYGTTYGGAIAGALWENDTAAVITYGVSGFGAPVRGRQFQFSPNTTLQQFGRGCGLADLDTTFPHAGSLLKVFAQPSLPSVLYVSPNQVTTPLGNCTFYVDFATATVLTPSFSHSFMKIFDLQLPDDPVFLGKLWVQEYAGTIWGPKTSRALELGVH